ncbi:MULTISPECIES: helix-turn-helix domain-containing protein [unclassified Pseudofrankia]|uniref:helix-turn-helix domain-containing protein n=1 Tax=unclassified Pseudofrankia TaxID=2994372 RepID=UPI0008DA90DD|nr:MULTISPECIES: helix-turn-helix domain-containing protein [unclassified Pseudofrankia]MDT3446078.1 helix-turn-helix domain-containing protein [Pseudofrankia sp. BMG5.37]OHV55366.1 AraC family transcriptional regulator [Pseudofrankia sp. BMG5.36]
MGFVLDTADLPPGERIDAVYAAMMAASVPSYVTHENPDGDIRTRLELWDLGAANIFTARSSGLRLLRTAKQAKQDAAPVVALSVQLLADGHHEQLGHRQIVRPGALMMVDLSSSYDFSWTGVGGAGCIQIPFDQVGLPVDVIRRAAANLRCSPLYGLVTDHVAHLVRDAPSLSADPAASTLGRGSIELARALLASAAHAEPHARAVLAETLLTQIRAYCRQHLADSDLRPAVIAATHNISLRYLYKICAQADFSLEQWIIGERLRGAREELMRPESRHRTIAMVARRWGFSDPTHFTRRFRGTYGLTPREWQRISAEQHRAASGQSSE